MQVTQSIPSVAVGKFLRALRMELGIESIAEAAKKTGCANIHNYTNIENGHRSITPQTMHEYATKLLDGDRNEALNRIILWAMNIHNSERVAELQR